MNKDYQQWFERQYSKIQDLCEPFYASPMPVVDVINEIALKNRSNTTQEAKSLLKIANKRKDMQVSSMMAFIVSFFENPDAYPSEGTYSLMRVGNFILVDKVDNAKTI